MKIIILAAGKGERLRPLTLNTPKPLLDLGNGLTLIESQLQSIQRSGVIDEVVLVTGYLSEQIDAKLKTFPAGGLSIRAVFNPFFGVSNNFMSMWLARHEMSGDFMVTNGDNLFAPEVFRGFVEGCGEGVHLAVGPHKDFDHDDMKVNIQHGLVARVSKKLTAEQSHLESPGLTMVRGARARHLFGTHLNHLAREAASLNVFWLEIFNRLYEVGVPVNPWEFDAAGKWQEIDFHKDIQRLRASIQVRPGLLE